MTAWPSFDVTISLFSQSVQKYNIILPVQDFISKGVRKDSNLVAGYV